MNKELEEKAKVTRKRICDILMNLSKPETMISDVVNDIHFLILDAEQNSFKEACEMMTESLNQRIKG